MKIVKPKLSDISALLKLWRRQYQYHHNLDSEYYVANSQQLNNKFRKYLKKAIEKDQPHILIAVIDNKLAGFVTYEIETNDYLDANITKYGEVNELFVAEEYRKKGVGKKLLESAEKFFASLGLEYVQVQLSTFNQLAYDFYEHRGYKNRQTLMFKQINKSR